MKNLRYILLLIITTTLSSCLNSFLDRDPYGSITENSFYVEKEHANLAAISCYSSLQKLNAHWADAQLELGMTDDFSSSGFKDASQFYSASFNPNESNLIHGIWMRAYSGIARCNKSLEGVESMPKSIIDEETKNKHLAEIKFIRAFWYYRLIQFYGDVPLRSASVEDPTSSKEVELAATPKEEIINKIILPDLLFASEYLPIKWDKSNYNRASKGAAFAYLCDVYLYAKNYEKAIEFGEKVEDCGYSLIENPGNVLRVDYEDCDEIIFSVGFGNGLETYREFYWGTIEVIPNGGRLMRGDTYSGDYFNASSDFIDSFQCIDGQSITSSTLYDPSVSWKNRDPRFDATFFTPMDEIETVDGFKSKWQSNWLVNTSTGFDIQKRGVWYGESTWNKRADIHLKLLSTVYLHIAEAYALKNNPDFSKVEFYLEKTRNRARQFAIKNNEKYIPKGMSSSEVLPKYKISSKEEAMTAINYESRVETFAVDCVRYFELKRWGRLQVNWPKVGGFDWDEKLYNLPYPSSELNANSNLVQKKGWGN